MSSPGEFQIQFPTLAGVLAPAPCQANHRGNLTVAVVTFTLTRLSRTSQISCHRSSSVVVSFSPSSFSFPPSLSDPALPVPGLTQAGLEDGADPPGSNGLVTTTARLARLA